MKTDDISFRCSQSICGISDIVVDAAAASKSSHEYKKIVCESIEFS
jgi:hypothetical protein